MVPPVTQQAGELAQSAPGYVDDVLSNRRVQDIDQHYHVVDKIQEEVNERLTDSDFMSQVAGGVLGAGRIVAEGIFSALHRPGADPLLPLLPADAQARRRMRSCRPPAVPG